MRRTSASNEHVREDRAEQAVEHDGLGEGEAEPLNALQLAAELGLPRDRLDHRAEDVADADPGAERAEADAESETDGLAGFRDVARRCCEKRVHAVPSLVLRLDRRADVDSGQCREDERLDADNDDDLEDVEERRRDDDRQKSERLEDEDQAQEGEDQDVPGEHVREESDAQRDQAHELAEHLERHDQREQGLRGLRDPALEVAPRAVPADPFDVREDEGQQGQRERHRQRARGSIDPPRRDPVVGLARQRQRNEPEQVDDEDEQEQRRDVRKPASDRLGGQALLGDLDLRDLVELLADGLPRVRLDGEAPAHEDEAEQDRQDGAEHQVDDGLRDREVERAEVDRNPFMLLELRRRVERAARERSRREDEGDQCNSEQPSLHRGSPPKYVVSESPSSNVYASAYVTTAATATCGCDAAVATSTARSTIALKKTPNACTAEPATLAVGFRTRANTRSRPWTNTQSTAASAQPETGQPSSRKTGSAARTRTAPPSAGSRCSGSGRGVEK